MAAGFWQPFYTFFYYGLTTWFSYTTLAHRFDLFAILPSFPSIEFIYWVFLMFVYVCVCVFRFVWISGRGEWIWRTFLLQLQSCLHRVVLAVFVTSKREFVFFLLCFLLSLSYFMLSKLDLSLTAHFSIPIFLLPPVFPFDAALPLLLEPFLGSVLLGHLVLSN